MIYLIDTDAIIKLFNTYSPKFFQPVWDEIGFIISNKLFISTKTNYEELAIKDDDCFKFFKNNFQVMFIETDSESQKIVKEILNQFPDLIEVGSEREESDPFLIATAITKKGKIITEERLLDKGAVNNPQRKEKMRIPNVCNHYGVPWMRAIQFMNNDEWRNFKGSE